MIRNEMKSFQTSSKLYGKKLTRKYGYGFVDICYGNGLFVAIRNSFIYVKHTSGYRQHGYIGNPIIYHSTSQKSKDLRAMEEKAPYPNKKEQNATELKKN